MIELPADQVLERLDHGNKWMQGNFGDWTDPTEPTCLHGAIRACMPQPGDAYLIEQVGNAQGWGTQFNDMKTTTFDTLKQVIVEHREITDGELEATFGPQWAQTVQLVRAAATITPQQVNALGAARVAARYVAECAARAAVLGAARAAVRGAALGAAQYAARAAVRGAARYAARYAALGVATHDLIGQHSYTQEHYDTLVGPWTTVMGDPMVIR